MYKLIFKKANFKIKMKWVFWVFVPLVLSTGPDQLIAQTLEIGGGVGYRFFLDEDKEIFEPAWGYELRIFRNQLFRYSADEENLGFSVGLYKFAGDNRKSRMDGFTENQMINRQVVETKFAYRYDRFISDNIALFWGGDAGFQFVYYDFNPAIQNTGSVAAAIYTRAILAPAGGINFEFNEYVAIYYRLEYAFAFDLSRQPDWGVSFPKLNHLLTNSTGIKFRF